MSSEKSRGHDRHRNWNVIVYPDSAPENWRAFLDELHIEWVESPLHEFDCNPTGEVKKPHWHVLLMFGGVKSYEQVLEIIKPLNCPHPQYCLAIRGSIRYMAHLDNSEKFQYNPADIVPHGGVDLAELLKPSASERHMYLREMLAFIRDNNVTEFIEFSTYCAAERDDWFSVLADSSTHLIDIAIRSQRHRTENKPIPDPR